MDRARNIFVGLLIVASIVSISEAQTSSRTAPEHVKVASVPARPEDVSTIDGIMKAYYETAAGPAGQPRQWARDRTLYMPGARLVVIMEDEKGKRAARQLTHGEFVDLADPDMVKNGFYEREAHRITYRYADWVHVISTSEARTTPDGPVTGHGIDNVELFWDGKRWWISYASIVFERPNEPLPKEYLP